MLAKTKARINRHKRIRSQLSGTSKKPRLVVYRSLQSIYAQLIDDKQHKTISASSSMKIKKGSLQEKAQTVGTKIAKDAIAKGIKTIVFDRNGYKYHGCVKNLAEAARETGLKF